MTAPATRVEPVAAPYAPELQKVFDAIMPPGVPPLTLFTTLARVPRIWDRFRAGSLLDRGPVSLRHREIVIDRTCARGLRLRVGRARRVLRRARCTDARAGLGRPCTATRATRCGAQRSAC